MSRNAFVVGDGLVVDQRAFGEVRSGNDDAAGALAVRGAGDVVSCGGGLKGGYGFNRDRRLWKQSEQLRKFRLHLGDVAAEIIEDLLGRGRYVFGIGFEGSPERGQIGETR